MGYSEKGWEKRKKDREGLKEFFEECVSKIKKEGLRCEECGDRLRGHVSEVAHILPKNYFRSIQTNPLNWLPLCGMYSANQCHSKFDDSKVNIFKNMLIYPKVIRIFAELEDKITEKIPYKIYVRYQEDTY